MVSTVRLRSGRASSSADPRAGAVLVLTAIMLVAVVGLLALAVDLGYVVLVRAQLQAAADAAALAGASQIAHGFEEVFATADRFARYHTSGGQPLRLLREDVELGVWDVNTRTFTPTQDSPNAVRVRVRRDQRAGNPAQLFFARALGRSAVDLSAEAIAMANPRDIAFVVDLSGSMNDDTEPAWATDVINATFGSSGYGSIGTELMQQVYDDFGFGPFPGYLEHIGQPWGVPQNDLAYAELTKDNGPLTRPNIPPRYRINRTDDELTRKVKAYSAIIDYQIARVMPNVQPRPDSSRFYSYWEKYLDYIIKPVHVRGTPGGEFEPPRWPPLRPREPFRHDDMDGRNRSREANGGNARDQGNGNGQGNRGNDGGTPPRGVDGDPSPGRGGGGSEPPETPGGGSIGTRWPKERTAELAADGLPGLVNPGVRWPGSPDFVGLLAVLQGNARAGGRLEGDLPGLGNDRAQANPGGGQGSPPSVPPVVQVVRPDPQQDGGPPANPGNSANAPDRGNGNGNQANGSRGQGNGGSGRNPPGRGFWRTRPGQGLGNRGWLPPNQSPDRITGMNNPNHDTFPTASSRLPERYLNKIGYLTYVQFMMDFGRDLKPDGVTYVPLSRHSPYCPYHTESTAGGTFSFPPREQPTHAARRALIAAIQVVKERNQGIPDLTQRDWVSIISFDSLSGGGPVVVQPLTGDYERAMTACTRLQACGDKGASTATEAGLIAARNHLKPRSEGGAGRRDTNKVVVLLTDGVPNLYVSSDGEIRNFISRNPSPEYYGGNAYPYDAALMQVAKMQLDHWSVFPVGVGLGTDYDFMDRLARLGGTADDDGQSSRGSGNPAEYEQRLREIFEQIIQSPKVRLVK